MKRQREEKCAEVDVDHIFLDQVLNKLYDFGKGGRDKQSKKKQKRKSGEEDEEELEEKMGGVKAGSNHVTTAGDGGVPGSAALRSGPANPTPAPTRSNVEIVTFLDPLKKNALKKATRPEAKPSDVKDYKKKQPSEALSIEKARLDVHRFGITGFQKQQQRVFEQDRAIMLGARPPKKEYLNYKVYQKMVKKKKWEEKEEAKSDTQRKKKKFGKQKAEKRKAAPTGRELTGLRGHFKDGVLVLNSSDIQKVNRKRRK